WLLEQMLPEDWERGRARRAGAILGGLLGAAPGLAWAINNAVAGRSVFSPWPMSAADSLDNVHRTQTAAGVLGGGAADAGRQLDAQKYQKDKRAYDFGAGTMAAPPVDVDEFNRTIWGEKSVANRLNPSTQIAASAAVGAAHR